MSEIKTVTHEGKVYEIGKYYLFSDSGCKWSVDRLACINSQNSFIFESDRSVWNLIKETKHAIGTITPAPIELDDGAAYMFDWIERTMKNSVGVYDLSSQRFYFVKGHILASYCTNIRLMTVESK
jgi:hypothetical protein